MRFTFEVLKKDKRFSSGVRKEGDFELDFKNGDEALAYAKDFKAKDPKIAHVHVHKTFVQRRNIMTGEMVMERFNTPRHLSVASETYWSQ